MAPVAKEVASEGQGLDAHGVVVGHRIASKCEVVARNPGNVDVRKQEGFTVERAIRRPSVEVDRRIIVHEFDSVSFLTVVDDEMDVTVCEVLKKELAAKWRVNKVGPTVGIADVAQIVFKLGQGIG